MKSVFVVGATGVGKSNLALNWAAAHTGAIVNADSVQMYEKLNIGSAKPTPAERARIPHFLFDFVTAPDTVTAGEFNRHFFSIMSQLEKRFSVIFVVGGTGFYFQAIERGLLPIPPANVKFQESLLAKLAEEGGEALHAELASLDPVAANRIHVRDHYRIARALDIIHATGKSVTSILQAHAESGPRFPYPLLKIGVRRPREELAEIVRQRAHQMLSMGWLAEVKGLLDEGLGDWEPLRSVGYKQCVEFLRKQSTDEKALVDEIVQETMKLAKKQKTWFQRDPDIHWIHPEQAAEAETLIADFVKD